MKNWINRKPHYLLFTTTLYRLDKRLVPNVSTGKKNYFCMRWGKQ